MSITMTGVITGSAVTGLTSPTYTLTADQATDGNVKRSIVTTAGGTQVGVRTHTVSDEFSVTIVKPKVMKAIQAFSSLLPNAFKPQYNRYWIIIRKGGIPASGLVSVPNIVRIPIDIAAGVDNFDLVNAKALISFVGGFVSTNADNIATTIATGVL